MHKNLVKIGSVVFKLCEQTDSDTHTVRQTDRQTDNYSSQHFASPLLGVTALPYRHLNAISKPTFSLILNWRHKRLCIPRRTLWRYTNVVLYCEVIKSQRTVRELQGSVYLVFISIAGVPGELLSWVNGLILV